MLGKLIYYTKPKETIITINMNKIVFILVFSLFFVIGFLIGYLGTERLVAMLNKILAVYSLLSTVLLFIKYVKRYDELFIYEKGVKGQGIDINDKKSTNILFNLTWKQISSIKLLRKGIVIKTNNISYSVNIQNPSDVADIMNMYLLKHKKE